VKSSVDIKSAKHTAGKIRLENQKKKDMEIAETLKSHDAEHNSLISKGFIELR